MGWGGVNIFDMIGQSGSSLETEEEKRRRLEREALDQPVEESMEDVQDYMSLEGEEEPLTIQAPRMVGTESPETAELLAQYKDWMSRRPTREQTDPSTGRQIAASLLGLVGGLGDPAAGGRITTGILEGPRNRAMRDWEEEGGAIGKVGEFAQNISETRRKRESDTLRFTGTQLRVEAQRASITQRKEAENLRHADRMANTTEDSEKRKEVTRHNKEVEKLAGEANRLRGLEVGTRQTTANAYASRVANLNKGAEGKVLPSHYRRAVKDSIEEMLAEYPDYQGYFIRNPQTKEIMVKPGLKLSPVDAQRFRAFLADAKERAKDMLNIDRDAVDDYNPMRGEIP